VHLNIGSHRKKEIEPKRQGVATRGVFLKERKAAWGKGTEEISKEDPKKNWTRYWKK